MKQRTFFSLGLAVISALAIPTLGQAQTNIGDLQQTRGTTVSGKVTSVVGNNFILEDDTGEVIVDAGPRWWREVNLSPGEEVTVTGEMGKGGELDAYSINRSNGSRIEIRSPDGPPPWAGGGKKQRLAQPRSQ